MEILSVKAGAQTLTALFTFGKGAYDLVSGVHTKLKILRSTLDSVKKKYNLPKDEEQLAREIEDVAYKASDLVDEIEIAVSKFEASNNLPGKIYKQSKMDEMQNDLEALIGELDGGYLEILNKSQNRKTLQETTSLKDIFPVYGRKTEQESIINLVNASDADIVPIIPIVGMIGIGKTKLARWVYHNADSDTFLIKMWVYVGQSSDVTQLTRSIIEAAIASANANANANASDESTSHLSSLDSLQRKLMQLLGDKKFLLILDDVWHEELGQLLEPLRRGSKGSKIILTTRSHTVTKSLEGAAEACCLKRLSDEDCWSILKDEATRYNPKAIIDKDLQNIGVKIAKKCKGFPLGAVSVGKLLSKNINKDAWENILKTQIWSYHNEAVEALRSRFCDHLPSHLKDCFAYCSIFPQSRGLEKDILAGMWIGEGFIVPTEDKLSEAKALEQLFSMTIFESVVHMYKMNQAVQDLALVVYGKRFFRMERKSDASINPYTRYLSLNSDKFQTKMFEKFEGLRTFLLFHTLEFGEVDSLLFMTLTRLRVLDLSNSNLVKLAPTIGNLRHLRFLDLSNNPLKLLPNEIGKLVLLQTLRLVNCRGLFKLPESISKLARLQHLQLGSDSRLTEMPSGIGKLRTLQTLGKFIVGTKSGEIKELKHMNSIRGSLCIQQLEKVRNPEEAREANLAAKNIQELELQWSSAVRGRGRGDLKYESVLVHLQAGHTVKSLTVRHYAGRYFPNWVSDENFNFTSIFLKDCRFCTALPPLGQLPYLKSLRIEGMEELKEVDKNFCGKPDQGFKKLESLELRRLPKLIKWSELRDTDMKNLNKLVIANCPEMNTLPILHNLRSLEKLEFENCPKLPSLPKLSSSLQNLTITDCAILENRCNPNGGADWAKIKDIPEIDIYYD